MSLCNIDELLIVLDIKDRTPATVARYDRLRESVEAAIKRWCKWELEQAEVTEYLDGNGYRDLPLGRPWVQAVASVELDPQGFYGDGPDPFGADTVLVAGQDYVLVRGPGGQGLLRYLTGGAVAWWWPSSLVLAGGSGPGPGLNWRPPPWWPAGYGNVKAVYTAGFNPIPDDIQLAVSTMVSLVRNTVKYGGGLPQSESAGDYSYNLSYELVTALAKSPSLASVRDLLAPYRDTPV